MADSTITKKALASSLKELMEELPFEKINIANICEKCGMNRKSFYYHFKDKYALVNWIFDTDFNALSMHRPEDNWAFLETICEYFYQNRTFYCNAFRIKGQNSFCEHFREFLQPLFREKIASILDEKVIPQICVDFFTDGIVCSIERWLLDKDCMSPQEFVSTIKMLVQGAAVEVCRQMHSSE